jgi:hypothetical protein
LSVDAAFDPRLLDYGFWAETCYQIRDKHGQLVPLRLNGIQRRLTEFESQELQQHGQARLYVLKGRQGGISTDQQARNLHQICTEPGFDAMTLAHIREDTDKLFSITQRAVENYPDPLRPPFGAGMAREVGVPEMDAVFWTGTAGAKRTGRGLTLKRVHGSEFAFWDQPRQTLATITPALVPSASVVTLETTASGYDSEGHNFWREAEQDANGYRAVFFPWWECDVEHYRLPLMADDELGALEPDEQALVDQHGLDHEQLKWRRAKMREMGRGAFLQEYAEDSETCWAAAGGMFYDAELLKALMARVRQPLYTDWGGAIEVYGEPREGERTVGGCDTAEGFTVGEASKKDRSAFTIRAFPSRRLLVKFEDRSVQPEHLAGFLNTWGRKYGGVYWVIEKNAHGITTLRTLRDKYKYQAIYHRRQLDANAREPASELIGWHTNEQTKAHLLDVGRTLLTAARDGEADVPTLSALRDAFAVRRDDKGKINLNGRDVLLSEMLCEVGHQSVPPQRSWWLGPLDRQTTRGATK